MPHSPHWVDSRHSLLCLRNPTLSRGATPALTCCRRRPSLEQVDLRDRRYTPSAEFAKPEKKKAAPKKKKAPVEEMDEDDEARPAALP